MILYIIIALLILLAVAISIANYAPSYFKAKYRKISRYKIQNNFTAGNFLLKIANEHNFKNLKLVKIIDGDIDNCCFVPKSNTIYIDKKTIESDNVASFAVVSHEFGHAIQHNTNDLGFKLLNALSIISVYLGKLAFPCVIVGIILMLLNITNEYIGYGICIAGAVLFVITFLVRLLTIKIEYQASNLGLNLLQKEKFDKKSLRLAKKLLRAAGLTYVGSFFASILAWTFLVPKYKH